MSKVTPLPQSLPTSDLTLKDVLNNLKRDVMLSLNCHHIGTIESFNASTQTVSVSIAYTRTIFTFNPATNQYLPTQVNYPLLSDVPVISLGGGPTCLTMPIAKGDQCLVLFNDRDLNNWFQGVLNTSVQSPRAHSLSDGLALVGLYTSSNQLTDYDTARAMLRTGNTANSITALGVNGSNGKILMTKQYPANTVTLNTIMNTFLTALQTFMNSTKTATTAAQIASAATVFNTAASDAATALGGLFE